MDLPRGEPVDLIIEDARYSVVIDTVAGGGDCHCRIVGGNPVEKSTFRQRAEMSFSRGGGNYFCWGEVFCTHPHEVIFIPRTPVLRERRRAFRFEVPLLPARVRDPRMLFRWWPIRATVWELSRLGTKIETRRPLEPDKPLTLEMGLGLLSSPDFVVHERGNEFFSTIIELRRSATVGDGYVYGAVFAGTSREYDATIGRFIRNLETEQAGGEREPAPRPRGPVTSA